MKRFYLFKTLLVVAGMLVGSNVWAAYDGYRTKYTQDFEGDINVYKADWTINGDLSVYSGSANGGHVFSMRNTSSSGNRGASISFANNTNFTSATDYIFEFDWGWLHQNKNEDKTSTLTVSSVAGTLFTITFNYNTDASIKNASGTELATLPVEGQYTSAKGTPANYYNFVIKANSSGIKLTVTRGETTYVNNVTLSETFSTFKSIASSHGRNSAIMAYDNFNLYLPYVAGTCDSPDYQISGVSGISRKFKLTCDTEGSTIYYSETELEADADGWQTYSGEVTTSATTIYAYAKTSDATSNVISFATGSGTEVSLKEPSIFLSGMATSDGYYNPIFNSTSDQTSVLLTPTATLAATFNGSAVTLPYTITAAGTLRVTASAEGYKSASTEVVYNIAPVYMLSRSADFTEINSSNIAAKLGDTWTISGSPGRWASWSKTKGVDADGTANNGANYYEASTSSTFPYTACDFVNLNTNGTLLLVGWGFGRNNGTAQFSIVNSTSQSIAQYSESDYGGTEYDRFVYNVENLPITTYSQEL